jgi:xylan 1,4-beta-xylosidase
VYSEDAQGAPVYDWSTTDEILDTIDGAGAAPLVELGFMPQALSTRPTPYRSSSPKLLDGGCFYPPRDYDRWAELQRAWARHVKERYGDVTASWLWELWNEPDIGYWHGTFDEYARLYDFTESAIHEVLPEAQLGGPAVAGAAGRFLRDFLAHCANGTNAVTGETGTRLDFVSFHAKGGVALQAEQVRMDLGSQLRIHRAGFQAVAAFPAFAHTPIYITEADPDGCAACPLSEAPENAYRLSPAYGAYELSMMKRSLELEQQLGVELRGVLTWAFTFPGTPLFAGYRALATGGIGLPVLGAFQLLGQLSGQRLPFTSSGAHSLEQVLAESVRADADIDGMATREGDTLQILVWSYHDDLVPATPTPVHLSVQLPSSFAGRARVMHQRVDESHGNAHGAWVAQGEPTTPSSTQLAELRGQMGPARLEPDAFMAADATGAVRVDFELPRFGVSLLTLVPAPEASGPGEGEAEGGGCTCRARRGGDGWLQGWAALVLVLTARFRARGRGASREHA